MPITASSDHSSMKQSRTNKGNASTASTTGMGRVHKPAKKALQPRPLSSESESDHDNTETEVVSLNEVEDNEPIKETEKTFADLGVIPELIEACTSLGFKRPSEIQCASIPISLTGRDIIGLAQTGSGKTAAFALPILQSLFAAPQPLYACVMAPTRELAFQISEQFEALGSVIGVRCAVIVGGMDMMSQSIALSKKPHIIICTPGRLVDHLENTKGFNLKTLKYLVMDEADRLLDLDFGVEIEKVLKVIPRERNTYLFSATMTTKVEKLQRASLVNPVKVEVATKYSTVDTLLQYYVFFPYKQKECYLTYLLNELAGQTCIVFTLTCASTQKLALMLRNLGFEASRTDIPGVDVVINYDVPQSSKDYIHRVGRTARAGRSGKSITLVTQYDVEWYQRIEYAIQKKLDEYPFEHDKSSVLMLQERVSEAVRFAHMQLKEENLKHRGSKRERDGNRGGEGATRDDEESAARHLVRKKTQRTGRK
ncbi:hypothetical protein BASA61_005884 [Batrachochytrium salamandrivorans]|nr:hypothetical protein BASA61_005884 [Batrachochytrium salamandrivorans]